MQAELEFLPGISPMEGAILWFCRGATMMRRMKAMSLSVFLAFSCGVTATEEKGDPVQFSPKEIRIELSAEEAQVSGGRQWGKIMILDTWLVGKPLPTWEGIRLDLDSESIKDRAVLVLFWDMNQRPSRRCMDLLAGQAESLRRTNVVAIAIQATNADESALREWIKGHKIPYSAGVVVGDAEKVRSAWAVQSLPWLILTDRQHRVRAEGFSIEKLTDVLSVLSAPRPA